MDNLPPNFGDSATFFVKSWANASNWRHDVITLIFEVTAHVGDAGHRTPSVYQVSNIWRIFRLSINRPTDLDLWPFDLLTPKWGHSHPCYELPAVNFQLATPFRSRRRVRHGTDRQTDRQRSSLHNAPTLGGGGRGQNNNNNNVKSSRFNNAMRWRTLPSVHYHKLETKSIFPRQTMHTGRM